MSLVLFYCLLPETQDVQLPAQNLKKKKKKKSKLHENKGIVLLFQVSPRTCLGHSVYANIWGINESVKKTMLKIVCNTQ